MSVEMEGTKPVTDARSKQVMLRAERKDPIIVSKVVDGDTQNCEIPTDLKVISRSDTYFGPTIVAMSEDGTNYKLTAPGPDRYLLLWKSRTDEQGFCKSWDPVAEVKARIADDLPNYDICPICDKPIRSLEHERLAIFGQCDRK